jgi:hypothetical protein
MARIAEDLLLLLLDNASSRPALERDRRQRLLGAAVLLDLAHACRIRPAVANEPVGAGSLLVLTGPDPPDPVLGQALKVLRRRPMTPAAAVTKLRRSVEPALLVELAQAGQIRPTRVSGKRFSRSLAWPFSDRTRVNEARAGLLSTLFDHRSPSPTTAAIISLLQAADGLHALLSLNERGWQWVDNRAAEIASGNWVHEFPTGLQEVNLAVTASALRPVLS